MTSWPDYCTREVLAKRLGVEPGYIDQLDKRGLLPTPVSIGEAKRWRWIDVDEAIRKGKHVEPAHDPYLSGIHNAENKATAARSTRRQQNGPGLLLSQEKSGN